MKKLLLSIIALVALNISTSAQEDMNATPISFEAVEDGTVLTVTNNNSVVLKLGLRVYTSPTQATDDVWYTVQNTNEVTLNAGNILILYSNCKDQSSNFKIMASKDVYVYGNPLSLVSQKDYASTTDLSDCADGVLQELFSNGWDGNPHIKNHPTKDIVLPATTLSKNCYNKMFQGTGLTRAPQLPAMTLTYSCYFYMFYGCKDLTEAPVLPAMTLADYCYYAMFYGCSSLATAPELPATTLTYECYGNMFRDCTSLTAAPVLPAPKPDMDSYYWMFYGCKNLKYVKCLATDISASSCTNNFLGNVSPTGTFVKADGMNDWTRDYNGVPEGWTIISASEEPTAVGNIENGKTNMENDVYDLQGRRVLSPHTSHITPLRKGVYIVNGKKIIVQP